MQNRISRTHTRELACFTLRCCLCAAGSLSASFKVLSASVNHSSITFWSEINFCHLQLQSCQRLVGYTQWVNVLWNQSAYKYWKHRSGGLFHFHPYLNLSWWSLLSLSQLVVRRVAVAWILWASAVRAPDSNSSLRAKAFPTGPFRLSMLSFTSCLS